MTKFVNKVLRELGLKETAIDIDRYTVFSIGCDRWTFPQRLSRQMVRSRIIEAASFA